MQIKLLKKYLRLITVLAFCVLLAGCNFNSFSFIGKTSKKTAQEYYLKFEYMDGTDGHSLSLKSGDDLDVHLEKAEGVISVVIGIVGQDYIYKTDDGGNMDFKLNIEKDGKYRITVNSKKAKGMVSVKVAKS